MSRYIFALVCVVFWAVACETTEPQPEAVSPITSTDAQGRSGSSMAPRPQPTAKSVTPGDAPGPCSVCGEIELVYLSGPDNGPIDDLSVQIMAANLRNRYGLQVKVLPSLVVPQDAFNSERGQYEGFTIIRWLRAQTHFPERTVIAVLNEDIYLKPNPDWAWAFSARSRYKDGASFGVISAYRMVGGDMTRRMSVMLGKYVGTLACDFEMSPEPKSIMFNNILSAQDLDGMNGVLCEL